MCGLAGYIGKSKNPKLTHELATNIFKHLELRGEDAAGIWGSGEGKNPKVIYHKEPIKSSEFVKTNIWKNVEELKPNILLMHARATSPNGGNAKFNKNNHPFTSSDKRIGLIHNGFISEIDFLKKKYEMFTDCDSEILLRMYESGLEEGSSEIEETPEEVLERMSGIEEIWSVVHKGMMAVGIGEIVNESRLLFLFRNDKRPLWIADLRKTLGQIFFFSSVKIWTSALKDCDNYEILSNQKLLEIPVKEVWFLSTTPENNLDYIKFEVEVTDKSTNWESNDFKKIQKSKVQLDIITGLDEKDEIIKKQLNPVSNLIHKYEKPSCDDSCDIYEGGTEELDDYTNKLATISDTIATHITNKIMEGSISPETYQDVLDSFNSALFELQGTWQIIKGL